jgi:hypothetical protein
MGTVSRKNDQIHLLCCLGHGDGRIYFAEIDTRSIELLLVTVKRTDKEETECRKEKKKNVGLP